ncbi:MAG: hypothetical protein IPN82_00575 [Chitinophagaceae bacterium]|nr:hypothetical protein [Chitinophagaceae bacterium]MBP6479167.1 hypothetical protein [Chitinophagaceae bacterium]MBP7108797.1 hypothetical protein [Chitinophagaceae bacterium]MBP7313705.1 hypothetical protein [Chitinophagaceae bacterium]HQV54712.1 hypothetical protein [Chitinophagaceae bacterium]
MNSAQIHLALNHMPLLLSLLGGILLIIGMIKKNASFKSLSLYLLVAAALFTAPVYLTGEGTEEMVEHLTGVNESAIEKHEDMAKITMVIIAITGAISLIGLFLQKNIRFSKLILGITLVLSFASFGTMAQTAHLGGLIRHSELQNGSVSENDKNNEGNKTDKRNIEKDDD